jgi:hypothetical protein
MKNKKLEKTLSPIPFIIDTNAFGHLSNKTFDELLLKGLEKNSTKHALQLHAALKKRNIVYHEIAILENLGFSQVDIHTNLKPIMVNSFEEIKKQFHPHFRTYERSPKKDSDTIALGIGFSEAMTTLFRIAFSHLLNVEPLLSKKEILFKLESQKKLNKNSSRHFNSFCKYITLDLNTKRITLAKFIALEAISRYCKNLMLQLYSGNREINDQWHHYITSTYFGLWESKTNLNAFRMISEELQYINNKFKTDFFPADVLRQHDDTVDGQIIHALGFGWYQNSKSLRQVAVLTSDPLSKVIARVKQYQAYLAYCQKPVSPNKTNISPRICHPLKPGFLYHLDTQNHLIQCVEFEPANVIINEGNVQIQTKHSDIHELCLR